MIETIFLDVDDTMYDEVPPKIKAVLQVVEYVSKKLGMPVQDVYDTFLLSKREIVHGLSGEPNQNNRAKWYERMLQNLKAATLDPQELSEMYWDIILDNISGTAAEKSLMIGDSPKKDIRGGKSVNKATGWLKRGRFSNADLGMDIPDIVIDTYLSLPEQIEQFENRRNAT